MLKIHNISFEFKLFMSQQIQYDKYVDINLPHMPIKTNYHIPTMGRSVKIVGLDGEPTVLAKKARKHGKLKIVSKKLSHQAQMETAFTLLDANFEIMEAHRAYKKDSTLPQPSYPLLEIPCRDRTDFQAGNWSRFANIWMIYISKKQSTFFPLFKIIYRRP